MNVNKIKTAVSFPDFTDKFGQPVKLNDFICMTKTGSTKFYPFYVYEFIKDNIESANKVKLFNMQSKKYRCFLIKDFKKYDIININNNLSATIANDYKKTIESINNTRQQTAIQNNKTRINNKFMPFFYIDNENKKGILFTFAQSQPGKAVSATDVKNHLNNIYQKYQSVYKDLYFVSNNNDIMKLENNSNIKPKFFNTHKTKFWRLQSYNNAYCYSNASKYYNEEAYQIYDFSKSSSHLEFPYVQPLDPKIAKDKNNKFYEVIQFKSDENKYHIFKYDKNNLIDHIKNKNFLAITVYSKQFNYSLSKPNYSKKFLRSSYYAYTLDDVLDFELFEKFKDFYYNI